MRAAVFLLFSNKLPGFYPSLKLEKIDIGHRLRKPLPNTGIGLEAALKQLVTVGGFYYIIGADDASGSA